VNCLVDTGCEVTLFPAELVDPEKINPTRRRVLAVNGTEIAVLGNATVTVMIGGRRMEIEGLVTKYIFDPILGIDWLVENDAVWRFREGTLEIRGQKFNLVARKNDATWARCVSVVSNIATTDGAVIDRNSAGQGQARPPSYAQKSKNARRKEKRRACCRGVKMLDGEREVAVSATGVAAVVKEVVNGLSNKQCKKIEAHKCHSRTTPRW
jgi:predicted aspartyl protease